MSILINFKICDNAKECNGIAICPTGALSWDKKKKGIKIDNKKCISCGKCESACMVGAIRVAKTKAEYDKIKKEIDKDPKKISDLFVDRYGAQPIAPAFLINDKKFQAEVLESSAPVAAELFDDSSIECLICSIPFKKLFENIKIKYKKVKVTDKSLLTKYKIKELPALLFFKEGKLLGKIEGFYDDEKQQELQTKIDKIMLRAPIFID
jgi:ferredoxin